jgi:hypothetical protein
LLLHLAFRNGFLYSGWRNILAMTIYLAKHTEGSRILRACFKARLNSLFYNQYSILSVIDYWTFQTRSKWGDEKEVFLSLKLDPIFIPLSKINFKNSIL